MTVMLKALSARGVGKLMAGAALALILSAEVAAEANPRDP